MPLGRSHGGFTARWYALEHAGRVSALVLYDTSPVADAAFWSAAVARMERFVQRHIAGHSETAGCTTAPNRGGGSPFDVRDPLSSRTAPPLVPVGADDFVRGPHRARTLHDGIPGAQLVILDEADHLARPGRPGRLDE